LAGFSAPSSEGEFGVKDAFGGSSFGSPAAAMPANAAAQQAPPASSSPSLRPCLSLLEPTDDMTDQCVPSTSGFIVTCFISRVAVSHPVMITHHQPRSSSSRFCRYFTMELLRDPVFAVDGFTLSPTPSSPSLLPSLPSPRPAVLSSHLTPPAAAATSAPASRRGSPPARPPAPKRAHS
jgi:hypothetical protein